MRGMYFDMQNSYDTHENVLANKIHNAFRAHAHAQNIRHTHTHSYFGMF